MHRLRFNAKCERIEVHDGGIIEVLFTRQGEPETVVKDRSLIEWERGEQYIIDIRPTSRRPRKLKGRTVNV